MDFEKYVYYDESSHSYLRWKKNDKPAGTLDKSNGYYRLWINGKFLYAHRVIYQLHFGPIEDGLEVDHKDRNRTVNRIGNLRLVTHKVNGRNVKKHKTNKSGSPGVSLNVQSSGYTYWQASWTDSTGKNRTKSFSVLKLGIDAAFASACIHREQMIAQLNTAGAEYSSTHGG